MGDKIQKLCDRYNIVIKRINFKRCKIRGFCYYDGEEYNIYIHEQLAHEQQIISTLHEIVHILSNHFTCPTENVESCEKEIKLIKNDLLNFIENNTII